MENWAGLQKQLYFEKNIQLNNYQNVTLIQKFVSNKSTTNSGIQSIALDDYFQQSNSINLIKMDIEGAEVRAVEGMKQLLENNQTEEGIKIPEVLVPYTGFDMIK